MRAAPRLSRFTVRRSGEISPLPRMHPRFAAAPVEGKCLTGMSFGVTAPFFIPSENLETTSNPRVATRVFRFSEMARRVRRSDPPDADAKAEACLHAGDRRRDPAV